MDIDIDKYIDWYNLTDDYELDSGDISPEDYFKLQLTDWGQEWSSQLKVVLESFDVVMANPARPV